MQSIYLIGIGGAGLSAIATVLLQQGYQVSGSDQQASPATARLAELGAELFIGHRAENLNDTVDVVVISSAIAPDNPELLAAQARGLKVAKRAEWLGNMMEGRVGIAIAGTHGKTTTTAMTAFVLHETGQDPTFIVGGYIPQMNTSAAAGQGKAFVVEADEYDHTFLGLRPQIAVVTIVEWDHPDIYPTPEDLTRAFGDFVQLVPPQGLVVGCGDAPGVREIVRHSIARVVTYGFRSENDWQAVDLRANAQGGYDFRIISPPNADLEGVQVVLDVPGLHNVYNALATLAVAQSQGVDLQRAAEVLSHFRGVGRRFEVKGEANGIIVIDDYAHHPTEIKATLAAARTRFGQRPIWVVFQPHTFSRTISLFDDFLGAFGDADHVIVVDIYASREQNDGLISSRDLVNQMAHPDVRYIGPLSDAVEYLLDRLAPPAALITLGAGD
ncbi:MAG: UDP-N-acetylmuramate--L-alanine ligase, partial [Anaerolineae bacterium]|nr:UDP-N-acetylmuramate--L-alanine ligase [Anaerolineae bacterium]